MSIGIIPIARIDPGYTIHDGDPHMTYQRPGVDVNFMWDGEFDHPIMVCPYGYAEPPTDIIPLAEMEFAGDPASVLDAFRNVCEAYLEVKGF